MSQVLLQQLRRFLQLLARLLLHIVGRGPLLPLSLVERGLLLPPFTVGGGPLLPLFMARPGPLFLYSGGHCFHLSVLGAWGFNVDQPPVGKREAFSGELRGRARPAAARRHAAFSLLRGRLVQTLGAFVRHGLAGERETREGRAQGRLVK